MKLSSLLTENSGYCRQAVHSIVCQRATTALVTKALSQASQEAAL